MSLYQLPSSNSLDQSFIHRYYRLGNMLVLISWFSAMPQTTYPRSNALVASDSLHPFLAMSSGL
jgi:hypothetical protein